MKTTTMNGKMKSKDWLETLFNRQIIFQSIINDDNPDDYPCDDVQRYSANTLLMVEELGELLKEDKRWRTFRGEDYDEKNKEEELADIFIVFMNLCLFSQVDAETLIGAVENKMHKNMKRAMDFVKDSEREGYKL